MEMTSLASFFSMAEQRKQMATRTIV